MEKNSFKTIIMLIISIFFVVFFQTVVYSAFSSSLNVEGNAYARIATDVRVTDFKISEKYSSSNYVSNYENFSKNTVSTSITFNSSAKVYYDVEVTNYNSNKVGIYSVSGLPAGVSYSFLDYTLGNVLLGGIGKTTFTICFTGSGSYAFDFNLNFRTAYSITYNDFDSSGYPNIIFENEEKVIDFGSEEVNDVSMVVNGSEYTNFTLENNKLTFGPVSGNVSITKKEDIIKIVSGDLNTVGSEVAIGDEHFYIISNTDGEIAMLSKYNLHVGNKYDDTNGVVALENPTGIQNSSAIGWFDGYTADNPAIGTTEFSSTNYWSSTVSTYPAYVYDSNSTLYNYVESYRTYLESQGAEIEETRLIEMEELEALGCSRDDFSCSEAPEWVYETSYWSGAAYDSICVWGVLSNGVFGGPDYTSGSSRGVRPVIVLKS